MMYMIMIRTPSYEMINYDDYVCWIGVVISIYVDEYAI
jgi:hypothetical protein